MKRLNLKLIIEKLKITAMPFKECAIELLERLIYMEKLENYKTSIKFRNVVDSAINIVKYHVDNNYDSENNYFIYSLQLLGLDDPYYFPNYNVFNDDGYKSNIVYAKYKKAMCEYLDIKDYNYYNLLEIYYYKQDVILDEYDDITKIITIMRDFKRILECYIYIFQDAIDHYDEHNELGEDFNEKENKYILKKFFTDTYSYIETRRMFLITLPIEDVSNLKEMTNNEIADIIYNYIDSVSVNDILERVEMVRNHSIGINDIINDFSLKLDYNYDIRNEFYNATQFLYSAIY